jgi:hypothetical protein
MYELLQNKKKLVNWVAGSLLLVVSQSASVVYCLGPRLGDLGMGPRGWPPCWPVILAARRRSPVAQVLLPSLSLAHDSFPG